MIVDVAVAANPTESPLANVPVWLIREQSRMVFLAPAHRWGDSDVEIAPSSKGTSRTLSSRRAVECKCIWPNLGVV